MSIAQAPNGITLVVETKERVYFGRLDAAQGGGIALKKAAVAALAPGEQRERVIRRTALFGFSADLENVALQPDAITCVRRLGEVPKE